MHTNDHKCGHSTSYIWWLWWRGISPWLRIRAGGATSISMTPVDVIRPKQDVLGKSAGLAAKSCSGVSEHPQELDHPSCFYFLSVFFHCWIPNLSCSVPYLHWWNAYFTGSMPMLLSLVQCRSACCDVLMPSLCFHALELKPAEEGRPHFMEVAGNIPRELSSFGVLWGAGQEASQKTPNWRCRWSGWKGNQHWVPKKSNVSFGCGRNRRLPQTLGLDQILGNFNLGRDFRYFFRTKLDASDRKKMSSDVRWFWGPNWNINNLRSPHPFVPLLQDCIETSLKGSRIFLKIPHIPVGESGFYTSPRQIVLQFPGKIMPIRSLRYQHNRFDTQRTRMWHPKNKIDK